MIRPQATNKILVYMDNRTYHELEAESKKTGLRMDQILLLYTMDKIWSEQDDAN